MNHENTGISVVTMQDKIERHFIGIVLLFASLALIYPDIFIIFQGYIPAGLGLIMFGIGINTHKSCFTQNLAKSRKISGLILFRFMLMPLFALFISYQLKLEQSEMIGLLILSTAPGGTAANVMAYLSKSNVALAVLLTFGTTMLSPILTPLLIYLLLNQSVTIPFWSMFWHIGSIIFFPITAGLFLNYFKIPIIEKIKPVLPLFSCLLVAIIIASIFALNQKTLMTFPFMAIFSVILLNLAGYIAGASIAYCMKEDKASILAAAFDYGMFDAIVAIVICTRFFSKEAAIPAVLMSIIQNLTAALIIRYQRKVSGFFVAYKL